VPALAKLLDNSDSQVASAAARALGQIGTTAAAEALMKAKPRREIVPDLTEAQLAAAEALAAGADRATAKAIYQKLWTARYPLNTRMAALAGLVEVDPSRALPEIVKLLKSGDAVLQGPAAGVARRFRDSGAFTELARQLPRLNPRGRVLVVTLLAERGDPLFAKDVVGLLDSADEAVRAAAAAALGKLGSAEGVEPLARLAAGERSEVQRAARGSLRELVAPGVDQRLLTAAAAGVPPVRAGAIQALADRQVPDATPVFLQAAADNNLEVARAAFAALGAIGTPDLYGKLVGLLAKANTSTELAMASKAVVSVGGRLAEPDLRRRLLLEALPKADGYGKAGLIELLAAEGGLEAFRAVREGLDDPNLPVRTQAVFALGHWSDPSVADELYKLAQGDRRGGVQTAALSGYLRSAALAPTNRLEMLRKARMILGSDAEKKMLLATLAEIEEPGALDFATSLLADTAVRVEAVEAVLKLADTLARKEPEAVQAAIAKLLQVAKDQATIQRAEAVLKKCQTRGDAASPPPAGDAAPGKSSAVRVLSMTGDDYPAHV